MEVAGIVLAVVALGPPTAELIAGLAEFYGNVRGFGKDSQDLSVKFQALTRRYESLQKLLFTKKFSFVAGTLFDELDLEDKKIVFKVLKDLPRLLYKHYTLERGYQIQLHLEDPTRQPANAALPTVILTAEQRKLLFDAGDIPTRTRHSSLFSLNNLAWAVRGRKRAERLNQEFAEWLTLIRNTLEDVWYPLSFFDKYVNLVALEEDADAQVAGLAKPAGLRKLLVDDAKISGGLNLGNPRYQIDMATDNPRRGTTTIDGQRFLVEILKYDLDNDGFLSKTLEKRFSTIAQLLHQQQDPELKVLPCKGYVNSTYPHRQFQLLFQFPTNASSGPDSLMQYLTGKSTSRAGLGERMRLGHELAQSLALMQSVGWIHRAIRSDNVLFFKAGEKEGSDGVFLRDPRLCGFEASRLESDFSTASIDDGIQLNIYRHPDRWGVPQKVFNKYHDIYSLGVVLLEIGLWEPAMIMGGAGKVADKRPKEVMDWLLLQARVRLGPRCGEKYRDLVIRCLEGNFEVDADSETKSEARLQGSFREMVVEQLKSLYLAVGNG